MTKSGITMIAGLVAAVVVVSCMDQRPTVTGVSGRPRVAQMQGAVSGVMSHDAKWSQLASEVPGFAGMYYADDGDLVVLLTDTGQAPAAEAYLSGWVGKQHRPSFVPKLAHTPTMRVKRAQYDFPTLLGYKHTAQRVVRRDIADFAGLGIDEPNDQLKVQMTSEGAAATMRAALLNAGIPDAALAVVAGARFKAAAGDTVADYYSYQPIVGGARIEPDGSYCTIGIPLIFQPALGDTSVAGFLTAQHCTDSIGDGIAERDSATSGLDTLGTTVVRPTPFSCSYGAGYCLYADVAAVEFRTSVSYYLGGIAHSIDSAVASDSVTGSFRADSFYLNPSTYYGGSSGPYLTDADNQTYDVAGDWLYKTGENTGLTAGKVDQTCWDTERGSDNTYIFCNVTVEGGADGGDSGSPVWAADGNTKSGNPTDEFHGIVWGVRDYDSSTPGYHIFVFSPYWEITYEILSPQTH